MMTLPTTEPLAGATLRGVDTGPAERNSDGRARPQSWSIRDRSGDAVAPGRGQITCPSSRPAIAGDSVVGRTRGGAIPD